KEVAKKNKKAAGPVLMLYAGSPGEDAGAEGDSRKQREEEQKQNNKNISSCDALFRARMDELGRTNFSTSRLLPVALQPGEEFPESASKARRAPAQHHRDAGAS